MEKLGAALARAGEAEDEPEARPTVDEGESETPRAEPGPASDPGALLMAEPATADLAPAVEPVPKLEVYRPTRPRRAGTQDDFYQSSSNGAIRARIVEVVQQEGPIAQALAARRVAAAWGFGRVGSRASERIHRLMPKEVRMEVGDDGAFLWPANLDSTEYRGYRVPDSNGDGTRQADELPPEEVGNAALHLLESHLSAPVDELVRETARLFGFQRVGRVVDERIRRGIEALVQSGRARREEGSVVLAE
jgi:hypothetical protein